MKLLIFEWGGGTYNHRDIVDSLEHTGIDFFTVSYEFSDKNNDDFFVYRFKRFLNEVSYDAVFSTNYFPLVAKCCHEKKIKYISWSYDNPLDVINVEDTLGYPENYVFLFDRIQVEKYKNAGFSNVFHMPLAVNPRRLDRINLSSQDKSRFSSDISFVGNLYNSNLQLYMSAMSEDMRSVIGEVVDTQMRLHGRYIVDDFLSDEIMEMINSYFREISPNTSFFLSREALSYAISAEATRKERLIIIKILSDHFAFKLFSNEDNEILKNVQYCGTCNYYTEMNKIFKASKINLNVNLKISQSGIPLRGMDVFGSGGFLLSTYQPEMDEFFKDGEGVVLFDSVEDAYSKADFYLKHEDLRCKIAQKGKEIAVNNYTYDMQLEKIMKTVFGGGENASTGI